MAIQDVILPYPDFIMGEVIDPEQFDLNNSYTVGKINELLVVLNQITDSADTGSGADLIDITPIAPFTSKKLQTYLNEVINRLKSTTAGSSGAGFIGTPPITGVTGTTISAQLTSLKTLLDAEKARITALEGRATTVEGRATNVETRATSLEQNKANKIDVYTKSEENALHNSLQTAINSNAALITSIQNQINALDNTYSTDAERVAAIQQVIASFEASDSQLSTLINNKIDKTQVYTKAEIDSMTLGSYAVANFNNYVKLATATNQVQINIPAYDPAIDAIIVFAGGTYQTIGTNVSITTVGGKHYVNSLEGTWVKDTVIDFVVTKNTKVLKPSDQVDASLALLDGTLTKEKFGTALMQEFDAKATNVTYGKVKIGTGINVVGGEISVADMTATNVSTTSGSNVQAELDGLKTDTDNKINTVRDAIVSKGGTVTGSPPTAAQLKSAIDDVATWDTDLIPANIKRGINIFGKIGTMDEGMTISPSSTAVFSSNKLVTNSTTTMRMVKEILFPVSGKIRVTFNLKGTVPEKAVARIYINDIPKGTIREHHANSYTSFTEDFDIKAGDRVQLYIASGGMSYDMENSSFQIQCTPKFGVTWES